MLYLGFILSIILYLVLVLSFSGYIVLFILKKFYILERFISMMFMLSLIVIMILSWSLIMMNGGFNVNLYISVDYSWVLLIALPFIIAFEVLDIFQRRIIKKSEKWYINVLRYLLPVLTGIIFFASTVVFYFNCHYFAYLLR